MATARCSSSRGRRVVLPAGPTHGQGPRLGVEVAVLRRSEEGRIRLGTVAPGSTKPACRFPAGRDLLDHLPARQQGPGHRLHRRQHLDCRHARRSVGRPRVRPPAGTSRPRNGSSISRTCPTNGPVHSGRRVRHGSAMKTHPRWVKMTTMAIHITGDPAPTRSSTSPRSRCSRDDARPAVPDGARVPRAGQGPGPVRQPRPGGDRGRRPRGVRRDGAPPAGHPPLPGLDGGQAADAGALVVTRSTTATPRGSGPRPTDGKDLLRADDGAARLRQAEGPDLRGAAGQAARRPPEGWEQAVGDYAEDGYRSVADVVDGASLQKVRDYKKAKKAEANAQAV